LKIILIIKGGTTMKLHSTMNNQEWNDLLNYLTARGALITFFAEKDNDGAFVRYKYALVEYKEEFYYMQNPLNMFEPFTVTRYSKVSPYEKQQNAYPREVRDTEQLLDYMNEEHTPRPLKGTHKQRLFDLYTLRNGYTDLWRLENELAGWREKDILGRLTSISMVQNTKDYCVLRFHSADGNHFDYETKSRRITG
jgi:hypothetical protein